MVVLLPKSREKDYNREVSFFKILLLATVGALCALPSLFFLFGIDLGVSDVSLGSANPLESMRGLLLHTIMLWTATCMAFFTFILAFFHYYVRRDVVVPVIGISLLWGGFIDLFQTLVADRFIQSTVDNHQLIPFTWAIGRTFGILVLLVGVMILMVRNYRGREAGNTRFFVLLAIAFGLGAFAVMDYLSHAKELPVIVFPNLLISRPWDVIPLGIYAIAGLWVFRSFHKARRDHFSFSVWVSVIPDIVAQLHMAFGSTELFDHSYNVAHGLKVLSYMVPAFGLLKDYVDTHHRLDFEIRERVRSEQDRQVLGRLVDNTDEMIGLLGGKGEFRYINRSLQQNLGISKQELREMTLSKILSKAEPPTLMKTLLDRVALQGHCFGQIELITRDAIRLIPVEYSIFPIDPGAQSGGVYGIVMRDITAQRQFAEDRERHERGLRNLVSQRTAELARVNDQMRQELTERRRLEERLVGAQKMEAMGQLSAGIAHEINNPVGFIKVNLDTLSRYMQTYQEILDLYERLDVDDVPLFHTTMDRIQVRKTQLRFERIRADVDALIAESRDGLARVAEIVRSLKSFSHPDVAERSQVRLADCMEDAIRVVWNQLKRFEIKKDYDELEPVEGWAVQLSQVFVNLLLNAAQAMGNDGVITIRIKQKGTHAMVSIADTGCGIAKEHYSRLFDPFFTTKPVGQGTGLGLYISYGIVQKHRGDLVFHSEEGKGTTFQMILPLGRGA